MMMVKQTTFFGLCKPNKLHGLNKIIVVVIIKYSAGFWLSLLFGAISDGSLKQSTTCCSSLFAAAAADDSR